MNKLIIFDIDGTLGNTSKVDDYCYMQAFKQTFGIDISDQNWEGLNNVTDWGITEEVLKLKTGKKPTEDEYLLMKKNFVQALEHEKNNDISQYDEVPGAKEFFNFLKHQNDCYLGIATGSWEESAKIKLNGIGIAPENVAFSNCNYHKSREAITLHAIELAESLYNLKFDDIIYFGDGLWDYKTCKNLEVNFIGIDVTNSGKLKNAGANIVFQNYLDKAAIIDEISKTQLKPSF